MPATFQLTDDEIRVAIAMREIRRGGGMQRVRDRIYGEVVDLGQHDALDVLVTNGACRMRQLADALRVDASTATRTVERLEAAGWAERQPDPGDRRIVVVAPTEAGLARHEQLRVRAHEALGELFGRFTPDELRQLADLLDRLVIGLDDFSA